MERIPNNPIRKAAALRAADGAHKAVPKGEAVSSMPRPAAKVIRMMIRGNQGRADRVPEETREVAVAEREVARQNNMRRRGARVTKTMTTKMDVDFL